MPVAGSCARGSAVEAPRGDGVFFPRRQSANHCIKPHAVKVRRIVSEREDGVAIDCPQREGPAVDRRRAPHIVERRAGCRVDVHGVATDGQRVVAQHVTGESGCRIRRRVEGVIDVHRRDDRSTQGERERYQGEDGGGKFPGHKRRERKPIRRCDKGESGRVHSGSRGFPRIRNPTSFSPAVDVQRRRFIVHSRPRPRLTTR